MHNAAETPKPQSIPIAATLKRPKIVFLDRIAIRAPIRSLRFEHEWIEHPTTAPADLVDRLHGAAIAITNRGRIGAAEIEQLPELRLIAVCATGTDTIDIAACARRGITVTNVRDWSTNSVAEHAFALMLALRRQLFVYRPLIEAGAWQRSPFYGVLADPLPGDLSGTTLGIVGHGRLGHRIAAIGAAFGMETLIAERRGQAPRDGRTAFADVLATSDIVCLACPLTDDTRGLIGAAELARMKPDSLLINCARGGIVDEAALADALRDGRIGGAGVDVLAQEPPAGSNPLLGLKLPNLIVTPHMAFASKSALRTLTEQLMGNIEAFVAGDPRNVVTPS